MRPHLSQRLNARFVAKRMGAAVRASTFFGLPVKEVHKRAAGLFSPPAC